MAKIISLLIIEDHGVTSTGLKFMFGEDARYTVLGVINHGDHAGAEIARLDPDIVILDMVLPGKTGLSILETLKATGARPKTLILSGQANGMDFKHAIDLGADAVISKTEPPELIFDALSVITQGGRYISEVVRAFVEPVGDTRQVRLTGRERQVLSLMANGFSNSQIAANLGIEERTARKHRENLMRKLKVSSAVDASRMAYQLGLATMTLKA